MKMVFQSVALISSFVVLSAATFEEPSQTEVCGNAKPINEELTMLQLANVKRQVSKTSEDSEFVEASDLIPIDSVTQCSNGHCANCGRLNPREASAYSFPVGAVSCEGSGVGCYDWWTSLNARMRGPQFRDFAHACDEREAVAVNPVRRRRDNGDNMSCRRRAVGGRDGYGTNMGWFSDSPGWICDGDTNQMIEGEVQEPPDEEEEEEVEEVEEEEEEEVEASDLIPIDSVTQCSNGHCANCGRLNPREASAYSFPVGAVSCEGSGVGCYDWWTSLNARMRGPQFRDFAHACDEREAVAVNPVRRRRDNGDNMSCRRRAVGGRDGYGTNMGWFSDSPGWICDGETNQMIEGDVQAPPPEFTCVQGAQNGYNQLGSFRGYTKERCEQECAANPECLSFDTSVRGGGDECYLSTTTAETGGGLRAHDRRYEYCERD